MAGGGDKPPAVVVETADEASGTSPESPGTSSGADEAPGASRWYGELEPARRRRRWRAMLRPGGWKGLAVEALGGLGYRLVRTRAAGASAGVDPYYVAEGHHHEYGRPWCLGRDQLDFLVERGLAPSHRLLDFGCGSLRAGVWLIAYLEEDRYFGVDAHRRSLEAGAGYEIPLHGLEGKRPRLLCSAAVEVERFGVRFDRVLAFSVLNHLEPALAARTLERLAAVLEPGGRLVLSHALPPPSALERCGLRLVHREERRCRLVDDCILWFELGRAEDDRAEDDADS